MYNKRIERAVFNSSFYFSLYNIILNSQDDIIETEDEFKMNKDEALKEEIDKLLSLSRYIDYKGRYTKDEIKKAKKSLEKLKADIDKGKVSLYDD